jgi:hypothetical protein
LEFRITRELARLEDKALRFLWCDGFIPDQYLLEGSSPRILGRAWICNGPRQDQWEFTLFLGLATPARDDIRWSTLLPADDASMWFTLDPGAKRIELRPRQPSAA